MKYCIAKFEKSIPTIPGMTLVSSFTNYMLFKLTDDAFNQFPFSEVPSEEVTALEGEQAWKYYGEVRGYRSAYSDAEGLIPDPDELAKGKRKTKVYITPEIEQATIQLMKRVLKRNVIDEFAKRESQDGKEEILAFIDGLASIREINYHKERLIGIEMPKTQLRELLLWDDATNSRIGRMHFTLGF